jgi:hypothetical protein
MTSLALPDVEVVWVEDLTLEQLRVIFDYTEHLHGWKLQSFIDWTYGKTGWPRGDAELWFKRRGYHGQIFHV